MQATSWRGIWWVTGQLQTRDYADLHVQSVCNTSYDRNVVGFGSNLCKQTNVQTVHCIQAQSVAAHDQMKSLPTETCCVHSASLSAHLHICPPCPVYKLQAVLIGHMCIYRLFEVLNSALHPQICPRI